eukprot:m.77119 g.77119  ORF g.77119 m.77119 type:complete len:211 (-) comp8535_c1_seq2:645-1277(-)
MSDYQTVQNPDDPRRKFKGDGTRFRVIRRPASSDTRLIIDLNTYNMNCSCKGTPEFVSEADMDIIPQAVADQGVSEQEWQKHMRLLDQAIRKNRMSVLTVTLLSVLVVTIPFIFRRINKLQRAVIKVMDDFNEQVLEKHGLYAKTQKSIFRADKYQEEAPWLAIALTKDDVLALRGEEHIFWYNPFTNTHTANDGCCKCMNTCCGTPQVI